MIYVLVSGSGSYDDYNQVNIFASLNKEKVEQKLKEYNSDLERATQAFKELKGFREQWEKENPEPEDPRFPKMGVQFSKVQPYGYEPVYDDVGQRWEHPLTLEYLTTIRKIIKEKCATIKIKHQELIEKYSVKHTYFADYYVANLTYWIDEVESD